MASMVCHVRPLSCPSNPLTFSRNRVHLFFFAILAISKNIVPRASSNPRLRPATLKAWHGNPAHSKSISGKSEGSSFVASSYNGMSGNCRAYTDLAWSSISHAPVNVWPRLRAARSNPPIPENRLNTLNHCHPPGVISSNPRPHMLKHWIRCGTCMRDIV